MARFFPIYAVGISFGLFVQFPAFAKPEGFHLKAGHAVLSSQDASSLKIESRGNAIVEWDAFPLAASEAIHFEQADRGCAVLNRILSDSRSEIFGRISSNGSVFLINPHGILIGEEAKINTAGFLASSLDVLDADFLAGKAFLFSGNGEGSIVNCGTISCPEGHIALLSRTQVENRGTLLAPNGAVCLAVGSEILLQPEETPRILIRTQISADEAQEGVSLLNTGTIQALAAELKSGSSAYAKAIQNAGIIEAMAVERRGGEIFLVAETGICENSGKLLACNQEGNGGAVHLLGKCVGLLEGAEVDASGTSGGGTILIGGDFQGKNSAILNAQCTVIEKGALLRTDATQNGDGGKTIVWANEQTRYLGSISARGGSQSGDGGFIEVSAPRLMFHGIVNAMAPCGKTGTLLLDPNDIVIDALATTGSFTACVPPATYTITVGTPTNQILNTDLQTQLAGCNVVISTVGSAGAGPNGGSITVSSPVSWAANNTLTLTADSFISIAENVSSTSATTGFTAINMTANGNTASTVAGITVSGGKSISTVGADITLTGTGGSGGGNFAHGISVTGASSKITTQDGAIQIIGVGKGSASSLANAGIGLLAGGQITATGTGTITLNGTGGSGATASFNYGIWVANANSKISTANNALSMTGTAGGGGVTSGYKIGVILEDSGQITTTGSGSVTIVGNGTVGSAATNQNGIIVSQNCVIDVSSGGSGAISVTGNSGASAGFSSGVFIVGGRVGGPFTTDLTITGTSFGTGTQEMGIAVCQHSGVTAGIIQIADNGTLTLIGTGGPTSAGSSNHGITTQTLSGPFGPSGPGQILLGSTGTVDATFMGQGGTGSGGSNNGIYLPGTFTPSTGNVTLIFQNCYGGSGGNNNHGVNLPVSISLTNASSTIRLLDVRGGTSASSTGNHGLYIPSGISLFAPTITTKDGGGVDFFIIGGAGSSCAGVYVNGGTLGSTSSSSTLFIQAQNVGTGSSAKGILIDSSGGKIASAGVGTITLTGSGGNGTGSCHGIDITSPGTISSVSGNVSLTGTATGSGTSQGTVMGTANGITSPSGGAISLNGTSTALGAGSHGTSILASWATSSAGALNLTGAAPAGSFPINLANNLTSNGNITFNSATGLSATVAVTGSGGALNTITFSTLDAATAATQGLTVNGGTEVITFAGVVGGSARLSALTIPSGTECQVHANITANTVTISNPVPVSVSGDRIITATGV